MVIWPFIHIRRVLFLSVSFHRLFSLFASHFFLLAFLSISGERILTLPSPLFRSHPLCSVRVADFPSLSRTPMRSILASVFFLSENTRTIKGTARQKYCPPLRKRHGNFNASAIPPLSLFRQRCCRSRYALFAPAVDGDIMVSLESSHVLRFRCRSRASLPSVPAPHLPSSTSIVSLCLSYKIFYNKAPGNRTEIRSARIFVS